MGDEPKPTGERPEPHPGAGTSLERSAVPAPQSSPALSRASNRPRSRSNHSAGIVRSIDEFEDLSAIAIRPSRPKVTSVATKHRPQAAGPSPSAHHQAVQGAVATQTATQTVKPPSRALPGASRSTEPGDDSGGWPQWALAVAIFGAVLWYIFSTEPPHSEAIPGDLKTDTRALWPSHD